MPVQSTAAAGCRTGFESTSSVMDEGQALLSKPENLCSMLAESTDVADVPTVAVDKQYAGDLTAITQYVRSLRDQFEVLARYVEALSSASTSQPMVRRRGAPLPVRSLRQARGWSQVTVVKRLFQVADTPLPEFHTMLAQYKRWDRGEYAPSEFYARLLRKVFDLDESTADRVSVGQPVLAAVS